MISAFHIAGPFIVAVSLDRSDVLVRFDREVRWSVSLLAVAAALLGATLIVLFRQMDAKVAAQRALEEARQAEAARLRASNEQLAAMVDREQRARREAETASALKDQFLMTISHELRTPLTAIAGWARLLVDDMVTEEQRNAALRTIDRNAQTQTRLIDDLLDVSGIMTGKLRLDVRRVQIDDVIGAAVDAVRPGAAAKDVEITATVAADVGFVMGDGERLQQIIWNLLSNAVKFTPNGGRVRMAASRGDEHVQIVVTDNGIGIPDAFLPHVFDRFRQADTGSSRRHGGLGLGLSIVRSLVELHGGTIDAHSDGEGKGASFTVRLPAPIRRIA
jgi:signal transduction histidine kinase